MREFKSVYRGFTPTDESDIWLGEIEISITDETIKFRIATGLEILEEELRTDDFRLLTPEEIKGFCAIGTTDEAISVFSAFKSGSEFPVFFFGKDPKTNEVSLLVRIGMGDMLGPTVLFGPAQVERGDFEKTVQQIEQSVGRKGILPRLRNNGKAEKESE